MDRATKIINPQQVKGKKHRYNHESGQKKNHTRPRYAVQFSPQKSKTSYTILPNTLTSSHRFMVKDYNRPQRQMDCKDRLYQNPHKEGSWNIP